MGARSIQDDIKKYWFIEQELDNRKSKDHLRTLRPLNPLSAVEVNIEGRTMINFCSNDYLGLSKHPSLVERSIKFTERYGAGSTGSRLICGTYKCFCEVEEKLAELKGAESALIMNSGFQANVSLLPALTDSDSLILSDSLNHRSIIDGSLLSRCTVMRFSHNDLGELRALLEENRRRYERILIVTESVFSVDGDKSNIDALVELANRFHTLLYIDDAHATGVLGQRGMGLTCGKDVDLAMGTFGKALGSFGSYIACPKKIRDYFINCCSGFIYTTAPPPSVVGAIDAALDLIPNMEEERRELRHKAEYLRSSLTQMGWNTGNSCTQIIPVIIGSEQDTLVFSSWLEKNNIMATPLRPPTVGGGLSRIRLTVSVMHTQEQLEYLIDVFKKWSEGRK